MGPDWPWRNRVHARPPVRGLPHRYMEAAHYGRGRQSGCRRYERDLRRFGREEACVNQTKLTEYRNKLCHQDLCRKASFGAGPFYLTIDDKC